MKKIFESVGMMLFLLLVVCAAAGLWNNMPEEEKTVSADKVKNWAKPDTEYLEYYGLDEFDTTLPVVYIDTQGVRITKESKSWVSVAVLNAEEDGSEHSIMDTPDYELSAMMKYRGASSYSQFDKKQYRIKFYKKEGSSDARQYSFLGMGRNSEWVLNGPFLDKTLMRNRLVYNLGREIFEWAPDTRYFELFIDGEYQGVYLAVEPVTNGESRLRLAEFGMLSGETAYIVKRDRVDSEVNPLPVYGKINGKTNNDLFIEYPSVSNITEDQQKWITNDISSFEEALYGNQFDDEKNGYAKYIDVDNFVDYYILNEVVMNYDAGNLSTYVYKELFGKLKLAIWDYNNCYDNYQWFEEDYSAFFLEHNSWFDRLLQDRNFVNKVIERYGELRKSVFSEDYLYKQIDTYQNELGDAVERNYKVWEYIFDIDMLTGREDYGDYDSAVSQLKMAINKRLDFLDNNLEQLYENCIN